MTALPDLTGLDGSQLVRLLSRPAPGLAGLTRGEWLAVAYLLASHLSSDQVDEWGAASAAVDYVLAAAETAGAMEHHETVVRRLNLSAAVLRRTPPRSDISLLNPDGMAGLFAATVPMSAQRARSLAADWRSLEVTDIRRLRLCENLVKPVLLVSHLMTDENAAEMRQWEELLPLLP